MLRMGLFLYGVNLTVTLRSLSCGGVPGGLLLLLDSEGGAVPVGYTYQVTKLAVARASPAQGPVSTSLNCKGQISGSRGVPATPRGG